VANPVNLGPIIGLRADRSQAFAEVVSSHYQAVYRFLFHLTRDVPRAEDLTQETFAAAWEHITKFQGRSTLATWMHRIAYTKFMDGQRSERRVAWRACFDFRRRRERLISK
jgi:RNA polymerase sigma-70 factor (ECF subfamily)